MSFIKNILSKSGIMALAAAAALSLTPVASEASTISMEDGQSTVNIGSGETLKFASSAADTGDGGAGSWEYTFGLLVEGTGYGTAVITVNDFAELDSPTIAWLDDEGNVITSTAVVGVSLGSSTQGFAELFTSFTDPDFLTQTFRLSWGEDTTADRGFSLSVDISTVPLPAGGLLLLTALGGVAALRRRRKAA